MHCCAPNCVFLPDLVATYVCPLYTDEKTLGDHTYIQVFLVLSRCPAIELRFLFLESCFFRYARVPPLTRALVVQRRKHVTQFESKKLMLVHT